MKKSWLLVLALCLTALIFLPTQARCAEIVDSGTCGDNLTWTLDSDGLLTISGTGEMSACSSDTEPWPISEIKTIVIEEGVTSIGAEAFADCINLTSVTISDTVTIIGSNAFYSCTSLTSIAIPDSVTIIDHNAFFRCSNLKYVIMGKNVGEIGVNAFNECYNLYHVLCAGTDTNWVWMHIYTGNDYLTNVIRHYNCTGNEITADGCTICMAGCTHIPGAEATATTDQVCTVCGMVLTPATGTPETEPSEPATKATESPSQTTTPSSGENVPSLPQPDNSNTDNDNTTIVIIVSVLALGGAAAGVILLKKKH